MKPSQLTTLMFLIVIISMVVIYPNASTAYALTRPNNNQMSMGWMEACKWLKESTKQPADYYDLKSKPSWGVMSWWDYGYWITREGQRPAMCNPGSNIRYEVARYLLSDNYTETYGALKDKNIQYIVIDYLMVTMKFYAIDTLAHAPMGEQYLPTKYQQDYMYWDNQKEQQTMLNYPEYYKSLVVRLYNFDGKPVKSPGTPVFIADAKRNITGIKDFPTYQEALEYVKSNKGIIAGSDPFLSPLEMNDNITAMYKLVWQSNSTIQFGNWNYPEVKVFEVVR
jgi:asparagine N-glycosylation enzyme membrane subunit Stt3